CVLSSAAVIPAPASIPYWQMRYAQLDAAPRTDPQVVFLGDSIFDEFANGPGAAVWNAQLAPLHAVDYAIGASMTQNPLWQIQQGQLDGLSPRAVVLLIGTNNLGWDVQTPENVVQGITAVVAAIQAKQPQAQILLLGILPRGALSADP